MNLLQHKIKIEYVTKFTILTFPKLRFFKSHFHKEQKQYYCELDDKLILNNWICFIDFKNKKFSKLNFKKYPVKRAKIKLKYPSVFSVFSSPKLAIPTNIYSKPIAINNKPAQINNIKPIRVFQNPNDLSISKNLTLWQTRLNQQIQICPILDL